MLDRTLTPALKERSPRLPSVDAEGRTGAVDFKIIDPTCGSGHFLLGAFERMLDYWRAEAPGMEPTEQVRLALSSIHGVDINPFAVAIAQFRLMVAALRAIGGASLLIVPELPLQVYAGDALLWSEDTKSRTGLALGDSFDPDKLASGATLTTEDEANLRRVLRRGQYDVVVGNPPYITVKDKALNVRYREVYGYCKGSYALTVPFMEQFHALARRGDLGSAGAGWIGQITSNSFMAREFGVPLIEEFFERIDLREIIDTSGAYIPGHGTPTVTIISRNRPIESKTRRKNRFVRAVLGIQGEPGAPEDPAQGIVWRSIVEHIEVPGHEDQWISVLDLPREMLSAHPWSLQGGSAPKVTEQIALATRSMLGDVQSAIGRTTHTGSDPAFFVPLSARRTHRLAQTVPLVTGESVRDYSAEFDTLAVFPYDQRGEPIPPSDELNRFFWRNRATLARRVDFEQTLEERGLRWFDHSMFFKKRFSSPLGIAFAFVATHNHFVLDRGGKVFNRSAPVIKLPEGASEDEHLELLGVLNSSTACFWLKQNSYPKGGDPIGDSGARVSQQPWADRYEFTGTTLKDFPLPAGSASERARRIDQL
ncbi:BREX-2 system adenine-specific DNA-methyltransferase PglX, partial [Dietzia sp. B44]|uniref:BREX-2 system adenine-specific DNA-methyltransferase PglX n=1 Tax=Dietzia sp. B44 TaxID=1630633 RepID=UPI0032206699